MAAAASASGRKSWIDKMDEWEEVTLDLLREAVEDLPHKKSLREDTKKMSLYFKCLKRGMHLVATIKESMEYYLELMETAWADATTYQPLIQDAQRFTEKLMSQMENQEALYVEIVTIVQTIDSHEKFNAIRRAFDKAVSSQFKAISFLFRCLSELFLSSSVSS